LKRLDLSLNAVTELGIEHLTHLASLSELRLQATSVGPNALATLATLPALEELHIDGRIASGDLSPIARCQKLRILSCPLQASDPENRVLTLPPNLEEISGVALTNAALFEQLVSLPRLKVLHTHPYYSSFEPEEVAAVQRFQAARPKVQVIRQ
jgi:hypothetical protein